MSVSANPGDIAQGGEIPYTTPQVTIIHISDLHLRHPLTSAGGRLRSRGGIKTHGYHFLQAASEAIRRMRLEDPDAVVLASGDLTTLGDPTSFDLARQFLENDSVVWDEVAYEVGLGHQQNYLVVPGNHDRYDDAPWKFQFGRFEAEFQHMLPRENWREYEANANDNWEEAHRRLPYVAVFAPRSNDASGREKFAVVIVGLDSTARDAAGFANVAQRVAQGYVTDESLRYLELVSNDMLRNERVLDSWGVRHQLHGYRICKIALLHHHPYLPPPLRNSRFDKLINGTDVVDTCNRSGFQMVAFGHQHINMADSVTLGAKQRQSRQMMFAAAKSLSIHGEAVGNGFNVYRITSDRICYETWDYDGGIFRRGGVAGNYGWR